MSAVWFNARRASAAAAAGSGMAATASAQTPPPYPLGEVIVSAERPVSEAGATVRTVTSDDIEASGARTLDEALGLLPGVEVRTGGGGCSMRAFRTRARTGARRCS